MRPAVIFNILFISTMLLATGFRLGCGNQPQISRLTDGRYKVVSGKQELVVDPAHGGRISSLSIDRSNFLTGKEIDDYNWGSTFWPSPQSAWNWPPSAEIDNQPYTVSLNGDKLIMKSMKDPKTGLVVTKEIRAVKTPGCFMLTFRITNSSDSTRKVAPWEITRVHTGGLTFFPAGKGKLRGGLVPAIQTIEGVYWFKYDSTLLPHKGDRQIYTDGSGGWMAHITGRTILVQSFPDISPEQTAPEEGEVELFASKVVPGKSWEEIENQGPLSELEPGASLSWSVNWFLRKLPSSVEVRSGNILLVEYVKKLISKKEKSL